MIAKGLTIPTTFTAKDKNFRSTVDSMGGTLEAFAMRSSAAAARSERAFRKFTPDMGHATKQLLSYASAGAALGGIAFSGKAIADYETSIQSLQAVTGVSDKTMVTFRKEIKEVAQQSRKSSIDVAKSFETIGSNMSEYLDDPKGLRQITEAGITLAKASRTELEPTLNDLTSIMNQFGINAGMAANTVNRLTAGEIVGSVRTNQLSGYLQEFGGVAAANNVTLSESIALVEAFGKQLPKASIGTAARNLITFMGAAKGMDKKARKSMRKYGVDMDFLMNKTVSLGAKIKELSKIKGDAVAMERFFGRENIAAGSVIFQQLETYNEYERKIRSTNQANEQAALNTATLSNKVAELKNKWITYITTNDVATAGLGRLKSAVIFVTDNMERIVTIGTYAIGMLTAWKIITVTMTLKAALLNIALGIQTAIIGSSSLAMKGNTLALGAQSVAMGIMSVTTNIATGNWAALNAMMLANPIGLVIAGVAALSGVIYVANRYQKSLNDEYQRKIDLRMQDVFDDETKSIKSQVLAYMALGMAIDTAISKTFKLKKFNIDARRHAVDARLKETKAQIIKHSSMTDVMASTLGFGERKKYVEQLNAQQQTAAKLAEEKQSLMSFAKTEVDQGIVTPEQLGFKQEKKESKNNAPYYMPPTAQKEMTYDEEYKPMKAIFTIKNDSTNQVETNVDGKSKLIMPMTSSTLQPAKR